MWPPRPGAMQVLQWSLDLRQRFNTETPSLWVARHPILRGAVHLASPRSGPPSWGSRHQGGWGAGVPWGGGGWPWYGIGQLPHPPGSEQTGPAGCGGHSPQGDQTPPPRLSREEGPWRASVAGPLPCSGHLVAGRARPWGLSGLGPLPCWFWMAGSTDGSEDCLPLAGWSREQARGSE